MAEDKKKRELKMHAIRETKDTKWAFEVLKAHEVNISKICRDAIVTYARHYRKEDTYDKTIEDLEKQLEIIKILRDREEEQKNRVEEIKGSVEHTEEEVLAHMSRMVKSYGKFSTPHFQRLCDIKQLDPNEVQKKIPQEWLLIQTPHQYQDLNVIEEAEELSEERRINNIINALSETTTKELFEEMLSVNDLTYDDIINNADAEKRKIVEKLMGDVV